MSDLALAIAALRRGELVAFPTETVYGLGANGEDAAAVARIFEAKRRPADRPLTLHVGRSADLDRWATWTPQGRTLAETFWPGPLTLIQPRTRHVPDIVTAGGETVGLRMPAHPLALQLLDGFGGAVAAPSANLSGRPSPTTAAHVRDQLPDLFVLDGGPCSVGVESTVLLLGERPRILRPGAVSGQMLTEVIGPIEGFVAQPGTHYQPNTPLRITATFPDRDDVAVISRLRPNPRVVWRQAPATSTDYARALYGLLHELDALGLSEILVEPIASDGPLWTVVRERLQAASATN